MSLPLTTYHDLERDCPRGRTRFVHTTTQIVDRALKLRLTDCKCVPPTYDIAVICNHNQRTEETILKCMTCRDVFLANLPNASARIAVEKTRQSRRDAVDIRRRRAYNSRRS